MDYRIARRAASRSRIRSMVVGRRASRIGCVGTPRAAIDTTSRSPSSTNPRAPRRHQPVDRLCRAGLGRTQLRRSLEYLDLRDCTVGPAVFLVVRGFRRTFRQAQVPNPGANRNQALSRKLGDVERNPEASQCHLERLRSFERTPRPFVKEDAFSGHVADRENRRPS